MKYVPSVIVGNSERGNKIVNLLSQFLPEKFRNVNLLQVKEFDDKVIEKARRIKAEFKEEFEFIQAPLFNLFLIFPEESSILHKIKKIEEKNKQFIEIITIHNEIKDDFHKRGTLILVSNITDKNEEYEEEYVNRAIVSYLLILLCSEIYSERDYRYIYFPGTPISIGIESNIQERYFISKYMEKKFIVTLAEELFRDRPLEENFKTTFKNWLKERVKFKEVLDERKIEVSLPGFNIKIPFFATPQEREKMLRLCIPNIKKSILKYLEEKKVKMKGYREEIEKRVMEKLRWQREKLFDFLIDKVKLESLTAINNALSLIIRKDGIIIDLIKERSEEIEWGNLSGYLDLDFKIKLTHPKRGILGILSILPIIPIIIKLIYRNMPLKWFILSFLIFLAPLIIYMLFSNYRLQKAINTIRFQWERKIKMITDFFHKAFKSLPIYYEIIYLKRLKKLIEMEYKNYSKWCGKIKHVIEKNKKELAGISNKIAPEIKSELDKFIKENLKFDIKDFINGYYNNQTEEIFNELTQRFIQEKLEDAIIRIVSSFAKEKQLKEVLNKWEYKEPSIFTQHNI